MAGALQSSIIAAGKKTKIQSEEIKKP